MNAEINSALVEIEGSLGEAFRPGMGSSAAGRVGHIAKRMGMNSAHRIKKRFGIGQKKLVTTKKTVAADKTKNRAYYRRHKSQIGRHRVKVAKTAQFKRRQAFLARKHKQFEGTETIVTRMAALLSE